MNHIEQPEKVESRETNLEAVMEISCEIYSRISGYYRPVQQYNPGKKSEFADRKYVRF